MRKESIVVSGLLFMAVTPALAQTKFSGAQTCAKPEPNYSIAVGDRADHVISLTKDKCNWTRGAIAGVPIKTDVDTIVSEDISATTSRDHGYGVTLLANGDTAFIEFEGTTAMREDIPISGHGTWSFTGGTGKLQGLKGKGTFDGQYNRNGTSTFNIEGEYQIAPRPHQVTVSAHGEAVSPVTAIPPLCMYNCVSRERVGFGFWPRGRRPRTGD